MTITEFMRNEYNKDGWYSRVVVVTLKHYQYKITVKQIRRELNKIIKSL